VSIELAPKVKEGRTLFVLIPLLLLHLTLLSLQIEDPAGTLLVRKWVLRAESPFLNISSSVSGSINKIWHDYFWLRGAREENQRLQNSLQQLSIRANRLEEVRQENIRLRQLLALNESIPFEALGARVVGRTPNYMSNVVYIDRGGADGVTVNAPVLSGSGIIGRTVLVTGHTAQVQLITNADASVGAMVDRTRSPGVLRGSGDPLLDMNYISNTEQINIGDLVVTSGLDGIFPKGLPIGKVVDSRKSNSVFRAIKVEPSADLVHIEEVSVLIRRLKPEKISDFIDDVK
jgi:rod shape-determining protein MreC